MNLIALKALLDSDAATAQMSAAEAAAWCNAKAARGVIAPVDVKRHLHVAGKWAAIAYAARGGGSYTDDQRLAAIGFVDALADIPGFDLDVSAYATAIGAGLDALVAAGFIAGADKDAILALGDDTVTRVAAVGLPEVNEGDVATARGI